MGTRMEFKFLVACSRLLVSGDDRKEQPGDERRAGSGRTLVARLRF